MKVWNYIPVTSRKTSLSKYPQLANIRMTLGGCWWLLPVPSLPTQLVPAIHVLCWCNLRFTPCPSLQISFLLGLALLIMWVCLKSGGTSKLTIDSRGLFPKLSAKKPKSHIKLAITFISGWIIIYIYIYIHMYLLDYFHKLYQLYIIHYDILPMAILYQVG